MKPLDIDNLPLSGTHLLEACAGTGKTWSIARIYVRLIVEGQLSIDEILVMTFTVAATDELKARLRLALFETLKNTPTSDSDKIKRLRIALHGFERAQIHTLHGFAGMVLSGFALESGHAPGLTLKEGDAADILTEEAVSDFWRKEVAGLPISHLKRIGLPTPKSLIKLLKGGVLLDSARIEPDIKAPPDLYAIENSVVIPWQKAQKAWKEERNIVSGFLSKSTGLIRKYYQYKWIPAIIRAADNAFLLPSLPLIVEKDRLCKISSEYICAQLKNGFKLPDLAIWDLIMDFLSCFETLGKCSENMLFYLKARAISESRKALEKRKQDLGQQTFDDLLVHVKNGLREPNLQNALRSRFKAGLIDEFQDTDPMQFEILTALFGHDNRPLYLIGDPKQAIYQFRGADLETYFFAMDKIPAQNYHTLSTNHRSHPNLIKAVNTLFSRINSPFVHDKLPFASVIPGPENLDKTSLYAGNRDITGLTIWEVSVPSDLPLSVSYACEKISESTAYTICSLLCESSEGRVRLKGNSMRPNDIAVLTGTNKEAALIMTALHRYNIPSVIEDAGNIFDTDEAFGMSLFLNAAKRPGEIKQVRTFLLSPWGGYDMENLSETGNDAAIQERLLSSYLNFSSIWKSKGISALMAAFARESGFYERLVRMPDGERVLSNFIQLTEILSEREEKLKLSPAALYQWLEQQRSPEYRTREVHPIRIEPDSDAVRIMTIHKSKGLEFPVVFCPFLFKAVIRRKGAFFYHNSRGELIYNLDSTEADANERADKEAMAEKMRLLYVALTRASSACFVAMAKTRGFDKSSLARLISEGIPDCIKTMQIPEAKFKSFKLNTKDKLEGRALSLQNQIPDEYGLFSFSSILRSDRLKPETVFTGKEIETLLESDTSRTNRSILSDTFPMGPRAGSCIHSIFESLDFTTFSLENNDKLFEDKLTEYGFPVEQKSNLKEMVQNTLETQLIKGNKGFVLKKLESKKRINELEFYIPLRKFIPDPFNEIINEWAMNESNHYGFKNEHLGFKKGKGFLNGFIDLLFEMDGKFYIVDWKSNYLGPSVDDYNKNGLDEAMIHSLYIIQYHIYTLAVHRFLTGRFPGYDYLRNFGGIFYLFVRGMKPELGPMRGVYFDNPPYERITKLERDLCGGKVS